MSSVGDLRRYLQTMVHREASGAIKPVREEKWPFITISRQAGAGGHTLGEALLQAMEQEQDKALFQGWQLFDHDLCRKVMEDPEFKVLSMESLLAEEYRSRVEALLLEALSATTSQDVVMARVFTILMSLAAVGKVILIGRAGACVTKDLPLGLRLRLVASEPTRVEHMTRLLGINEEQARAAVRRQDGDRARLVRAHFHRDINDPLLYDIVSNTDSLPITSIAHGVIALIKDKAS